MVDGRMRLSAKARSSGTAGLRWWHTINMSRCSSSVLTVCGRVGLVDEGSTFGCGGDGDDVGRVAAARALGVVRVDRPAGDGGERDLDVAGLVEGVGVDGGLHAVSSQTRRQASMAAGVVPQSSCSLKPDGAAAQLLAQPLVANGVALAEQRDVDRAARRAPRASAPGTRRRA